MREGRGQLSSMDQLPEEAEDDVVWALGELYKRSRTQADILFEFNDRLAVKGLGPISKSSFNRKAVRAWASLKRMQETKQIFEVLSVHLSHDKIDDQTVALGEFIKQLIFDLLAPGAETLTADSAMKLARAFKDVISGQKISAERRSELEKEFAAKASKAVETVAKSKGLTGDTIETIKREILGLRDEANTV